MRGSASVLDLLTSDGAILLMSVVGLGLTTVSIVRDTRKQHGAGAAETLEVEDLAA